MKIEWRKKIITRASGADPVLGELRPYLVNSAGFNVVFQRDFGAGWSIGKARYSDAEGDTAWHRGYIEAMQAKRGVKQ